MFFLLLCLGQPVVGCFMGSWTAGTVTSLDLGQPVVVVNTVSSIQLAVFFGDTTAHKKSRALKVR